MELIEREGFLNILQSHYEKIPEGEGHCIFISGEAGIGKTSLVKAFCKKVRSSCNIYQGICDALFAPRPLAPLYDILLQIKNDLPDTNPDITDRTAFFSRLFYELKNQEKVNIIVFEDIHWADEATLDFIKFLARRITQLQTLFILTYRDNEIDAHHPLRHILGHLNPDSFTRLPLLPLSRQAVEKMADEKGYKGEDVYSISGGNPFYVNEILASYSLGVPENIKDAVLSTYNRLDEITKHIWEILCILPTSFEVSYLEKMEPAYSVAISSCLDFKILVIDNGLISFKHELFRRTIELSLSPLVRVELHRNILNLFLESFEKNQQTERIIHHAKNANEYDLVVRYAPLAAKQAASLGAHIEASKLYLSAIEYYQGNDKDTLIGFYDSYAYECYLTNQIKEAIIYTTKALEIRKGKNDIESIGSALRFLSRLWWFDGNRKKAEAFAVKAIEVLADQQSSRAKAMAFSNMSQLKMLADQSDECILWGEKAITMAKELNDEEILSHALNNVGDVYMRSPFSKQKGIELLQQSLDIALKNAYHEHAARAYTNLGSSAIVMKDYTLAKEILEKGIQYCEERDLDSWTAYMMAEKARVYLKTGHWNEAYIMADNLHRDEYLASIVKTGILAVMGTIKARSGDNDVLPMLLESKKIALETMELQRIIPAFVALLEYEWITNRFYIEKEDIDTAINMVKEMGNIYENNEFAFWLLKSRGDRLELKEKFAGYEINNVNTALKAASLWEQLHCPYEQALALFEGKEDDKKIAVSIMQKLGATAVYEKMKFHMRSSGIKSIPRGIRKSTRANPANLTERELDVLQLLKEGLQNKEIADKLFISPKTVDHHISSIFFKLEVNSRAKAVQEATRKEIIK
ncbi:AAA family ATPase [Panacibacter ginsenosidivorans]|uniref:AAA family ATPase n=1 Tax=Panacibacter ginsenosidivorans TaxID=1813871 RepID=A0A5B8VBR1_9BACT|nr:helix-turn-helix transcriptional regulator [Panacibacter ginsenosidivorans]QEC68752.1 AAA family ATPase [Panacibacter ginsenosidivorans]